MKTFYTLILSIVACLSGQSMEKFNSLVVAAEEQYRIENNIIEHNIIEQEKNPTLTQETLKNCFVLEKDGLLLNYKKKKPCTSLNKPIGGLLISLYSYAKENNLEQVIAKEYFVGAIALVLMNIAEQVKKSEAKKISKDLIRQVCFNLSTLTSCKNYITMNSFVNYKLVKYLIDQGLISDAGAQKNPEKKNYTPQTLILSEKGKELFGHHAEKFINENFYATFNGELYQKNQESLQEIENKKKAAKNKSETKSELLKKNTIKTIENDDFSDNEIDQESRKLIKKLLIEDKVYPVRKRTSTAKSTSSKKAKKSTEEN